MEQQHQFLQHWLQYELLHRQEQPGEFDNVMVALAEDLQRQCATQGIAVERAKQEVKALSDDVQAAAKGKDMNGPCEYSLDPVLQAHKIQRQVYHGGAFIGNHIHLALKPTVVHLALDFVPLLLLQWRSLKNVCQA